MAQAVADQIIRTGHVERGYVGLRLQEITPAIAQALGRPDEKGVLVASVEAGVPAEKAGIKAGDVIVSANKDISRPTDVAQAWSQAQKDKMPVLLRIIRDGLSLFVAVTG